jgi:hypothetical protein
VIQKYICSKCEKTGSVYYYAGEDLMSVVYRIEDDHKKISPDCTYDFAYISTISDDYPTTDSNKKLQ